MIELLADRAASLQAALLPRPSSQAGVDEPDEQRTFRHDDWGALITRFAPDGEVDYRNFQRVRRLLESYLSRLSRAVPAHWPRDDQLAFYLNAFNAIAVHQVTLHYPVTSIRDIPLAFARPYPIGRELHSLNTLRYGKTRGFRDPRIHAALAPASVSSPALRVYTGTGLDDQLEQQMQAFVADPERGARVDSMSGAVHFSRIFRSFAGDFANPAAMPSAAWLALGRVRPALALPFLRRFLPPEVATTIDQPGARIGWLPYRWDLNDSGK